MKPFKAGSFAPQDQMVSREIRRVIVFALTISAILAPLVAGLAYILSH